MSPVQQQARYLRALDRARAGRGNTGRPPTFLALQRVAARRRYHINRSNRPRKPGKPKYKKKQFLKALRGTCGVYSLIAENLGSNRHTVRRLLERPDWADVRAEWDRERELITDEAYNAILHAVTQRVDVGTAARTAQWLLQNLRPETFGERRQVTLEGGKNPIRTENKNLNLNATVDLSDLNLAPDARRAILAALDAQDREQEAAALAADQAQRALAVQR